MQSPDVRLSHIIDNLTNPCHSSKGLSQGASGLYHGQRKKSAIRVSVTLADPKRREIDGIYVYIMLCSFEHAVFFSSAILAYFSN